MVNKTIVYCYLLGTGYPTRVSVQVGVGNGTKERSDYMWEKSSTQVPTSLEQ